MVLARSLGSGRRRQQVALAESQAHEPLVRVVPRPLLQEPKPLLVWRVGAELVQESWMQRCNSDSETAIEEKPKETWTDNCFFCQATLRPIRDSQGMQIPQNPAICH